MLWRRHAACIKRRAAVTDSPGGPHQPRLEKLRRDNLSTNHFGLMTHATGAAGEWDVDAAVD